MEKYREDETESEPETTPTESAKASAIRAQMEKYREDETESEPETTPKESAALEPKASAKRVTETESESEDFHAKPSKRRFGGEKKNKGETKQTEGQSEGGAEKGTGGSAGTGGSEGAADAAESKRTRTTEPNFVIVQNPSETVRVLGQGAFGIVVAFPIVGGGSVAYKTFLSRDHAASEVRRMMQLAIDDEQLAGPAKPILENCGVIRSALVRHRQDCPICKKLLTASMLIIQPAEKEQIQSALTKFPYHFHVQMPVARGSVYDLFTKIINNMNVDENDKIRRKTRVVHKLIQTLMCLTKRTKGAWVFSDAKTENVLFNEVPPQDPNAIGEVLQGGASVAVLLADFGAFCKTSATDPPPATCTFGNPCIRPGSFPPCNSWLNVFACVIFLLEVLGDTQLLNATLTSSADAEDRCALVNYWLEELIDNNARNTPILKVQYCIGYYWRAINAQLNAAIKANESLEAQNKMAIDFQWESMLAMVADVFA